MEGAQLRLQTYLLSFLLFGAFLLFMSMVWRYTPGPTPSTFYAISRVRVRQAPTRRSSSRYDLELAGSGSNLPLTRILLQSFAELQGYRKSKVKLYQSIGSTGGIQAVLDKNIDIGLISRVPREQEKDPKLTFLPYARVAVVVAVHPDVPEKNITKTALLAIYKGKQRHWSNGQRIVVLQRERGDSSHRAVSRVIPSFQKVNDDAYRLQQWRVLYQDSEMQRALMNTPGSIGLFNLGAILSQKLAINYLSIHGVRPSLQTLRLGSYPFHKEFSFVIAGRLRGIPRKFVQHVFSTTGKKLMREHGYLPLEGRVP